MDDVTHVVVSFLMEGNYLPPSIIGVPMTLLQVSHSIQVTPEQVVFWLIIHVNIGTKSIKSAREYIIYCTSSHTDLVLNLGIRVSK